MADLIRYAQTTEKICVNNKFMLVPFNAGSIDICPSDKIKIQ